LGMAIRRSEVLVWPALGYEQQTRQRDARFDGITRLKDETDQHIVAFGGARFVQLLSNEGLTDEYRLAIYPVALGKGLPLFKDVPVTIKLLYVPVAHRERDCVTLRSGR
jgi:dihydrofolate reductase